ncbi:MAG: helix-turn-helix transcriptional regulator, partial [Gemmatimonadales bacterium]
MPTKPSRWLDLIAFLLQHRYPVTREEVYAQVQGYLADPVAADEKARQSARRKFERDKDELRGLGIEIETVEIPDAPGDEAALGYRLRPGNFYQPYLELEGESAPLERRPYPGLQRIRVSREDLELLDRATRRVAERGESPLAHAARSARRKLKFDLPLPMAAVERLLGAPMDDEGSRSLALLQRGAAEHVAVRCRYYAIGRDQEEPREIEPYGLFFNWGRWYCVARGRLRNALRVFRVDRMRDARLMTGTAAGF